MNSDQDPPPFLPMNCPDCGAALPPAIAAFCPACVLSNEEHASHGALFGKGLLQLPYQLGDYRLARKLGEGGMGVVFDAEHLPSGRRLALKVLKSHLEDDAQRERFLREGRLSATIDHPNSVYVFGTETVEGIPVIAMELAPGGTLHDAVKQRGPFPVREAVDAILQVMEGLQAAHARGVLHRDIKPSNCFLSADGRALVGDYGLSISHEGSAEHSQRLTLSGVIMGTPAFCAPEQLRGEPLDLRADLYATGATLFYLLTGKAPARGSNPMEVIAAVLEGKIQDVGTLRPDLPRGLAAVLAQCLSGDPRKRHGSYQELRRALLPFSSAVPAPAPIALRAGAGLVDVVLLMVLCFADIGAQFLREGFAAFPEGSFTPSFRSHASGSSLLILFFFLSEWLWGATPGKRLFGICVVGLDGARPRALQSLGRALLVGVPYGLLSCADQLSVFPGFGFEPWHTIAPALWPLIASGLPLCLLFRPAFRHLEGGAWHDRVSQTRVVYRVAPPDPVPEVNRVPEEASAEDKTLWGPIQPGTKLNEYFRIGFDPLLRRNLFLELRTGRAGPSAARRESARAGRLRWLQSVRDEEGGVWEVWQCPKGAPLKQVLQSRTPVWKEVLVWLKDLAVEFDEASKDGTLPAGLSLGNIWITTDGHAILLDQSWQNDAGPEIRSSAPHGPRACQMLLAAIGAFCPPTQRPRHATELLEKLHSGQFEKLSHLIASLAHLQQRKSVVPRGPRVAATWGSFFVTAALLFVGAVAKELNWASNAGNPEAWQQINPAHPPLPWLLDQEITLGRNDDAFFESYRLFERNMADLKHPTFEKIRPHLSETPMGEWIRLHILGNYEWLVQHRNWDQSRAPWSYCTGGRLVFPKRDLALTQRQEARLLSHLGAQPWPHSSLGLHVDAEILRKADREVAALWKRSGNKLNAKADHKGLNQAAMVYVIFDFKRVFVLVSVIGYVLGQLVFILVQGAPCLMRLSGIYVVTKDGQVASRGRMLWRWFWGWLVLYAFLHESFSWVVPWGVRSVFNATQPVESYFPAFGIEVAGFVAPVLFCVGYHLFSKRSLLDRVSGTWLVCR